MKILECQFTHFCIPFEYIVTVGVHFVTLLLLEGSIKAGGAAFQDDWPFSRF
jgi:hypothetical protein